MLWSALARRDFSFVYVAEHISRTLPLGYRLSAFWGGQEGSLLLWLLILSGYAALAVWLNRRRRELIAWVVPVLAGVATFFAFMLCFVSSPFGTAPAPADGAGMVPSLQNPYMLAHPPLLYLGYVGLTIPFAFAMGALLSGRTDERWIVATRRWTLSAWTFLGVGQLLGAHWAYVEIGWGGYYAWDPVENAALMPWLAATAFLHSVMIQEKRGMLKVWNMILVSLAFLLSIFGTFLTRSGVINSIHSFSQSPLGGWFLGFIVVCTVFTVALIYLRLPLLRARTKLESLVSREATFLYNNLLLVALCLTILWGVVYPLLTQAVRGETRSVSKPYYDFFLHSFGLPLILLMGIGPLVAWRRASLRALGKTFLIPLAASLVTGGVLIGLGFDSSWPGLLAYTFSAFVAASIVLEFVRGTRATGSLFRLIGKNRRRYGGYIVHAAVLCSRSASPVRARTRPCASAGLKARPVARARRLHAPLRRAADEEDRECGRDAGGRHCDARQLDDRHAASGQELLSGRARRAADLERGVDLPRPAQPRRPLPDRRPDRQERDALSQGARETARQPDLGRRASSSSSARSSRCGRTRSSSSRLAERYAAAPA